MRTIICRTCGKTQTLPKGNGNPGKYCSIACKNAAAVRVSIDCLNCSVTVVKLKSQARGTRYCSETCRLEHKYKARVKTCENCGKQFDPNNKSQRFCSVACRVAGGILPGRVDGRSSHQLYPCWYNMKRRCTDSRCPEYPNYGGRGITVFENWLTEPASFYRYVDDNLGPRPEKYSLDRIDVNGNYEPGNIRWASAKEQVRNRRPYQAYHGPEENRPVRLHQRAPKVWVIS